MIQSKITYIYFSSHVVQWPRKYVFPSLKTICCVGSDKLKNDICRKYVQKTSNLYEKPKAQKTAQKDRHFRDNEKSIAHNHVKRRRTSLMFRQIQITRILIAPNVCQDPNVQEHKQLVGLKTVLKNFRKLFGTTIWFSSLILWNSNLTL